MNTSFSERHLRYRNTVAKMYPIPQQFHVQENNHPKKAKVEKEALDEIRCESCGIWCLGHHQYLAHTSGSKHLKKQKKRDNDALIKDMPFIKVCESPLLLTCTVCNVGMNASTVVMLHVKGGKHQEKIKNAEISTVKEKTDNVRDSDGQTVTEVEPMKVLTNDDPLKHPAKTDEPNKIPIAKPSLYLCSVCNITTNSQLQLEQHQLSSKHKNRENSSFPFRRKPKHWVPANGSTSSQNPHPVYDPKPLASSNWFQCNICNIFVNSQNQLEQHLSSLKHKSKSNNPRLAPYPQHQRRL